MKTNQDPALKFDTLRQQAERLMRQNAPLAEMIDPSGEMIELIHELKVHQVELQIQNEELRRAQQEITELHREYERLYEFAPCGYVTLDAKGIITHVNLTGVKLLGTPRRFLRHSGLSLYIAEQWQDHYLAARRTAAETGRKQFVELELKRKNGTCLWVRADIQADRDENDAIIQWSVILTDITSRRKADEERRQLEDQLRHAQKMETIGTLAGGVAHDFNNILTIIIGNYELIKEELPQWSPLLESLDQIRAASLRARDVVRQLLTFARRDDSQQTLMDIIVVLRDSLKLIRSTIPSNIDIRQRLPEDAGPILGNSTQINQLIINLCNNAADAMLPGGGRLTVAVEKESIDEAGARMTRNLKPGPHIKIVVKDTGRGMDARTLKHIFEPYFTTKPLGKGTGIGLAVVHGIVDQHNGEIFVESEPEKGTTFTIFLPAFQGQVEEKGADDIDLPKGDERILFVDDETSIVNLAQSRLSFLGYRVTGATDPRKALEMVKEAPSAFDLVITDMAMPGMTGDALASELFRLRPDLPIILCTGYSENIDVESARKLGMAAFLMKPVELVDLALAVRKTLDEAPGRKDPQADGRQSLK